MVDRWMILNSVMLLEISLRIRWFLVEPIRGNQVRPGQFKFRCFINNGYALAKIKVINMRRSRVEVHWLCNNGGVAQ
jgi:hypothetical protein